MRLRLAGLNTPVLLEVDDPHVATPLARLFADLVSKGSSPQDGTVLKVEGTGPWRVTGDNRNASHATLPATMTDVLNAVNRAVVARTPLLAFHAAVVTRHGRSLVIPGRSGIGKTTLTACLLRRGWNYVSDEALSLEWHTGSLVSYPRPMALSPWSCGAAGGVSGVAADGEHLLRAVDVGADVDRTPGPVRFVVLPTRTPWQEHPSVARIDRNDALAELLQRGFTLHVDTARALVLTSALLRNSAALRVRLGNPLVAADVITAATDDS
jgi:hypothetical protein